MKCFHVKVKGATKVQRSYQLLCAGAVNCAAGAKNLYLEAQRSHGGGSDQGLKVLRGQVKFTLNVLC